MRAIRELLIAADQPYLYALVPTTMFERSHGAGDFRRVRPGEVATHVGESYLTGEWVTYAPDELSDVVQVEVHSDLYGAPHIDHHENDRAAWEPNRFLEASSIGQVIAMLGAREALPATWKSVSLPDPGTEAPSRGTLIFTPYGWGVVEGYIGSENTVIQAVTIIPEEFVFEAAADHCMAAAFAGQCPGIDPKVDGAFWQHVVQSRHQTYAPKLSVAEFNTRLALACSILRRASPAMDLCDIPPSGPTVIVDAMTVDAWGLWGQDNYVGWLAVPGAEFPLCRIKNRTDGGLDVTPLDASANLVRDLTWLRVDGDVAEGTGEQYPAIFQYGPLAGSICGLGYLVRIKRADGRMALRLGGCGKGTPAGTAPVEKWLHGVGEARGCLPASAPRPDNLYGFPVRGMGGGTLR